MFSWDIKEKSLIQKSIEHEGSITAISVSPNGQKIVVAYDGKMFQSNFYLIERDASSLHRLGNPIITEGVVEKIIYNKSALGFLTWELVLEEQEKSIIVSWESSPIRKLSTIYTSPNKFHITSVAIGKNNKMGIGLFNAHTQTSSILLGKVNIINNIISIDREIPMNDRMVSNLKISFDNKIYAGSTWQNLILLFNTETGDLIKEATIGNEYMEKVEHIELNSKNIIACSSLKCYALDKDFIVNPTPIVKLFQPLYSTIFETPESLSLATLDNHINYFAFFTETNHVGLKTFEKKDIYYFDNFDELPRIELSPDGKKLAISDITEEDGKILIIDTDTPEKENYINIIDKGIHSISFSENGKRLAIVHANYDITIFSLPNNFKEKEFTINENKLLIRENLLDPTIVKFHPTKPWLIIGTWRGQVYIYDLNKKELINSINLSVSPKFLNMVLLMEISKDGKNLAVSSGNNMLTVIDLYHNTELPKVVENLTITALSFHPHAPILAIGNKIGDDEHAVSLLSFNEQRILGQPIYQESTILALQWGKNGKNLYSINKFGKVNIIKYPDISSLSKKNVKRLVKFFSGLTDGDNIDQPIVFKHKERFQYNQEKLIDLIY